MSTHRSIIYIERKEYLINKAIVNHLTEAGFDILSLADDINALHRHRHDADIFLYNLGENARQNPLLQYLADLCRDENKSLALIGEDDSIDRILRSGVGEWVACAYARPIDMNIIVADMLELATAHEEFRRQKTILIVDDDKDFLTIMQRWLQNAYTVEGARSGAEALAHIAETPPDLILLDYEMPELDGYEVMDRLHRNPSTSRIPIIFLTGINDRESVMRIIKHRPDGYLLKSMKKRELLDTLERFFAADLRRKKRTRP